MNFIGVVANSEAARALKRVWFLQHFLQALEQRDKRRREREKQMQKEQE